MENKDGNDQSHEFIVKAKEIIDEAVKSAKEISNNLSPAALRKFGIKKALESFIDKVGLATPIHFSIIEHATFTLSKNYEFTLYRTLTELINNSIKYSDAQAITIEFQNNGTNKIIKYSDNGNGFNYENTINSNKGFGLLNIQNRIEKLGGTYQFISSPGNGVKVTIVFEN